VEGAIAGNIGVQAIASGVVRDLRSWREIIAKSFMPKRYAPERTGYFDDHAAQYRRCLRAGSAR
jgi:hypothetical protein